MRSWTKSQTITYSILLVFLVIRFTQSVLVLLHRDVLTKPGNSNISGQLGSWADILYAIFVLGGFPLIVLVIGLNRDHLAKLNVDKFYIVLLVISGALGLYELPYNCFTGLALIYAIFLFFDTKARFGIPDRSALRIVLPIIGALSVVLICIASLVDPMKLESAGIQAWIQRFSFAVIPGAVYEEAVFRGMLYMFLKDLHWGESRILFTQAFVFWIVHINYVVRAPIYFWIYLPMLGLGLGYIAFRSRSITPSSLTHILYNFLADVFGFL